MIMMRLRHERVIQFQCYYQRQIKRWSMAKVGNLICLPFATEHLILTNILAIVGFVAVIRIRCDKVEYIVKMMNTIFMRHSQTTTNLNDFHHKDTYTHTHTRNTTHSRTMLNMLVCWVLDDSSFERQTVQATHLHKLFESNFYTKLCSGIYS